METIIPTEDGVKVVEMKEVVKEEYTMEQLQQELEAIESEIKNYDIIVERRLEALKARKQRIEELINS